MMIQLAGGGGGSVGDEQTFLSFKIVEDLKFSQILKMM